MRRGRNLTIFSVGMTVVCGAITIAVMLDSAGPRPAAQPVANSSTQRSVSAPAGTTTTAPATATTTIGNLLVRLPARPAPTTAPRTSHRTTVTIPGVTTTTSAAPLPPTIRTVALSPMPEGDVEPEWGGDGALDVRLDVAGLAPDSAHMVDLEIPDTADVITFPPVIADSDGQVDALLVSAWRDALPVGSRLVLWSGDAARTAEPVAVTGPLTAGRRDPLVPAVAVGGGTSTGGLAGTARLSYDPTTETLTVTVTASGLPPGAHALDLRVGSCADQGRTGYPLPDLVADSRGRVSAQTRTLTSVANPLTATDRYLDLHEGTNQATDFGSLLCADF